MQKDPCTILLVEDNEAHAELIFRSLQNNRIGWDIVHVSDGEAALDYLFRQGDYANLKDEALPRVVLLDLRLPRIDGLEVLQRIKDTEGLKKIPVVILSTSSSPRDVSEAYERHANSYLVKPVEYARFSEMMGKIGDYWMNLNLFPGV